MAPTIENKCYYDKFYVDPIKLENYLKKKFNIEININNLENSNNFIEETIPDDYFYKKIEKGKRKNIYIVKKKTKLPNKEAYKNNGKKIIKETKTIDTQTDDIEIEKKNIIDINIIKKLEEENGLLNKKILHIKENITSLEKKYTDLKSYKTHILKNTLPNIQLIFIKLSKNIELLEKFKNKINISIYNALKSATIEQIQLCHIVVTNLNENSSNKAPQTEKTTC